jgi:hypothetical protein
VLEVLLVHPGGPLWAACDKRANKLTSCEIARGSAADTLHNFCMSTPRLPLWYRHAWWVPGTCSAFAMALVVATLRPSEQSILLTVAILCALPWAFVLLLLDFGQGFADRAAVVVCIGLIANAAMLWWSTAVLRARFRQRQNTAIIAVEA